MTNVVTESLNVGTEGYLNLTVTNAGAEPATNAIVRIARNGQSPDHPGRQFGLRRRVRPGPEP